MKNPVVHFEIISGDSARSKAFYSELFNWNIDSNNSMNYGMINTGAPNGIQGGIGSAFNGPSYATFYVQVENLESKIQKAQEMGATVVLPKTQVGPSKFISQLKDKDGVVFGLIEQN